MAIASTPVKAEHPDAKALRISSVPTVSVTGGSECVSVTAGCERTSPVMITTAMDTMNASVGIAKTRADSARPQRFTPVMRASVARQSHTRAP